MTYKNYDMLSLQQKVNEVDNKAEQTYVDEKVNKINSSLEEKANKTDINDKFSKVNSSLEEKANKNNVISLESKINAFQVEQSSSMTDTGSLELIGTRTNKFGNEFFTATDRIKNVEEMVLYNINKKYILHWEHGTISTNDGTISSDANRVRTVNMLNVSDFIDNIKVESGYKANIYFYNEDDTYKFATDWKTGELSLSELNKYNSPKFKVVVREDNTATINPLSVNMFYFYEYITSYPSDETVSYPKLNHELKLNYDLNKNNLITNLFDKNNVDLTGCYIQDGSFWKTSNYYSTNPMSVKIGDKIKTNLTGNTIVTLWDKNLGFISGVGSQSIGKDGTYYTIPNNSSIAYVRLSIPYQQYDENTYMVVNADYIPPIYLAYGETTQRNDIRKYLSKYYGEKMFCFGDSYTHGQTWQKYVVDRLGLSGYELLAVWGGTLTNIWHQIANAPTGCKIITVFFGTNDYANSREIGSITDDVAQEPSDGYVPSFYSALKYVAEWISTNRPEADVLFISHTKRFTTQDTQNETKNGVNDKGYPKNNLGYTLEDYSNAIENIANMYSYKFCDLFHHGGVNKNNATYYYESDLLHPNSTKGGKLLGNNIANVLLS